MNSTPDGLSHGISRVFLAFLVLTASVCGAAVMVLEVLGSKVLGPFFGVSLFVWTSLITVTLVSLALGYAAGGVLADRMRRTLPLYVLILVAGLLVLLIPHARSPVLKSCMTLGLRGGSLASSGLLFGPALFFLGCTSPYVVRIAAREAKTLGKTVGVFYATSTLGSFLGTLLTGFVLIAYFRVDRIFQFTGASLVVLAAGYLVLFHQKHAATALLAFVVILQPPRPILQKVLPNGTTVRQVFSADTFYGNVKVLEYSYGEKRVRELMIDGLIQGGIDTSNGMSVYQYPYLMEFLPYGINPRGRNCLVLGLGAGVIPRWYEDRGIRTDAVDINPEIPQIAARYFDFHVSGSVSISDARYYLMSSEKRYDYLIVDLANGDWAPAHILSLEFFKLLAEHLTPDGVLAINLIGSLQQDTLMTASVVGTLGQAFRNVNTYVNIEPGKASVQNLELIAYQNPGLSFSTDRVSQFPIHPMVEANIREVLGREFAFPTGTPWFTLTDQYNPIDVFDLRVKEKIRQGILEYTDWDMLI